MIRALVAGGARRAMLGLAGAASLAVAAADAAAVAFWIDAQPGGGIDAARVVDVGDVFSVDVLVGPDPAGSVTFNAFDLGVTFDPALVDLQSIVPIDPGPAGLDVPVIPTIGRAGLSRLFLTPVTLTAPTVIARVELGALGAGSLGLGFSGTFLVDGNVLPNDGGVTGATIDIQVPGTTVPAPATALLVGAGLLLAGSARRRPRHL
ncbi:MAG: hypothetical protein H6983_07345 [Ectothiorhodospiraceae bacterium]|nr:hypothetical protein [Chromatiales bacterium]MCP5153961.1 hypothetical protein [Ectothiorhodospiraceae bacterium]